MIHTVRVRTDTGPDLLGESTLQEIRQHLGITGVSKVSTTKVYRLEGVTEKEAIRISEMAFSERINQTYTLNSPIITDTKHVFEIGYKPGVMNPEVGSILKTARDLGINPVAADSSREYAFYTKLSKEKIVDIIHQLNLYNKTVEQIVTSPPQTLLMLGSIGKTTTIPIREMTDSELLALSKDTLFLDLPELHVIKTYFIKLRRDPTDCELEVLAQTWSEHCNHKTFKAKLTIDGKKKQPLFQRIKATAKGHEKLIVSAFVDNSGVIEFYDGYGICAKVETHNSPSAIEPYGGAMTGSGGVFRDVLGTGQGAKVLMSSDIFCFAPPTMPKKQVPPGCLPPEYLLKKVVHGVRDYGNRVGIPTNNGSVHFHPDFRAKPTIAVGAYGIIPKSQAVKKSPLIGDILLTLGGRTGRDGIHGATFSSAAMTDTTTTVSGSAVQIGDAIEEKRVIDAVLTLSHKGLIRAITDCGAGGFSSAIGEMASEIGATVYLEKVPLKYPGMNPWEIFISESQERMVLAIDPAFKKKVLAICKLYNVEAAEIGVCDGSNTLQVFYGKEQICDLSMHFLHDGLPQRQMKGTTTHMRFPEKLPSIPNSLDSAWESVMQHGNVCSKEPIVRMYDHNVQGRTALHPFGGVAFDGPQNGAIVKPFYDKPYGLAVSHGLNPVLNTIDPYWGSIWAITEAVSNYVSFGGDLRHAAFIDNFVWPFPDEASLADLDQSVDACTFMSKLLFMPFVSGKDSLSSTYRYPDNTVLKIPPVLLISVFGKVADVKKTVSSDFKQAESTIVLVGQQDYEHMGGSTYFDITNGHSEGIPRVALKSLVKTLTSITKGIQAGDILSCHDISEGGIAAAIAEMSFGGGFGVDIDLAPINKSRPDYLFFNETAGTFLVEVSDSQTAARLFRNVPHVVLGETLTSKHLVIRSGQTQLAEQPISPLKEIWQRPMKEVFQ